MRMLFTVEIEVDRTEGKFASRDELESLCLEALEGANPDTLETGDEASYMVSDWVVEAQAIKPLPRKRPETRAQREEREMDARRAANPLTAAELAAVSYRPEDIDLQSYGS